MSAPLVSVVIPCYRQGHFLPGALASVFAQTHPAVEPVVVNDGSDDDTDAVARGFGARITYVSQANAGLSAARNAGIAAAAGEYLLFLDADDRLHPVAVAALVAALAGHPHAFAQCACRDFATDPEQPTSPLYVPEPGPPLPRLIHNNVGPPNAFLTPRALAVRVGGFAPELRSCEDWDFWTRLALAGAELVVAPELGAYYRQAPGSMSTNRPRMLGSRVQVLLRTYERLRDDPAALARWGGDVAAAALRVRRRLRLQGLHPDLVPALTRVLDELRDCGVRPPASGKEGLLRRVVGRDLADRLLLAYYRRFDRPMLAYYQRGIA